MMGHGNKDKTCNYVLNGSQAFLQQALYVQGVGFFSPLETSQGQKSFLPKKHLKTN